MFYSSVLDYTRLTTLSELACDSFKKYKTTNIRIHVISFIFLLPGRIHQITSFRLLLSLLLLWLNVLKRQFRALFSYSKFYRRLSGGSIRNAPVSSEWVASLVSGDKQLFPLIRQFNFHSFFSVPRIRTRCRAAVSSSSSSARRMWRLTQWPTLRFSSTWHSKPLKRGSPVLGCRQVPNHLIPRSHCRTTVSVTTMEFEYFALSEPGMQKKKNRKLTLYKKIFSNR